MGKTGFRGSFSTLMNEHPDVAKRVIALKKERRPPWPLTYIHREMLSALRQKGVDCSGYPFNTQGRGYQALSRYLQGATHLTKTRKLLGIPPIVPLHSGTQFERMILFDRNRNWPPAVYFEHLRYIGKRLPQQTAKVVLAVDVEDIRVISAYRVDGSFIENLTTPTLARLDSPYSLQKHRQEGKDSHYP